MGFANIYSLEHNGKNNRFNIVADGNHIQTYDSHKGISDQFAYPPDELQDFNPNNIVVKNSHFKKGNNYRRYADIQQKYKSKYIDHLSNIKKNEDNGVITITEEPFTRHKTGYFSRNKGKPMTVTHKDALKLMREKGNHSILHL